MTGRFRLPTELEEDKYVIATYLVTGSTDSTILRTAETFAVGQTIGTWVDVPQADDALYERFGGYVVSVQAVPSHEVSLRPETPTAHLIGIALPTVSFGSSFPMMLTTLLGNDASTSVTARLVDLALPAQLEAEFGGPRFGVEGVRELVGVTGRPLLLNMVKPCVGLAPEQGAAIVRQTAMGGVDLIKDDELLGSPDYSRVVKRVRAYNQAIAQAAEETGKEAVYLPNVTERPARMLENAAAAVDAGARGLMVNYAAVGYGAVQDLVSSTDVPVLGHLATAAIAFEGADSGMSAALAWGLFPRLAGIDMAIITTRRSGYPISDLASTRAAHQLALPHPRLRRSMPVVGGAVHPGTIRSYVDLFGPDIILGVGGAIQGHPSGACAGARAVLAAIDAAVDGTDIATAGASSPDLAAALELWGTE